MGFRLARAAPCVKRIVDHHPMIEHFVVIREVVRQPEREREQSSGLRSKIQSRGIGAPNDDCKLGQ